MYPQQHWRHISIFADDRESVLKMLDADLREDILECLIDNSRVQIMREINKGKRWDFCLKWSNLEDSQKNKLNWALIT